MDEFLNVNHIQLLLLMKEIRLLLLALFYYCSTAYSNSSDLQLSVNCESCKGEEVALKIYNPLNAGYEIIGEGKVSDSGKAVITVEDIAPTSAYLSIGENRLLWLSLSDGQMNISIDSVSVRFSGNKKEINDYYHKAQSAYLAHIMINGQFIMSLPDINEKRTHLEKLGNEFRELGAAIRLEEKITDSEKETYISNNDFILLNFNRRINERSPITQEYSGNSANSLPLLDELPVHKISLEQNNEAYTTYLRKTLLDYLYVPIEIYIEDNNLSGKDTLAILAAKMIKSKSSLKPIEEYLLAYNIESGLTSFSSLSPSAKFLFQQFKTEYPQSKYIKGLESVMDSYAEVSEGATAKDIIAHYEDGSPFSLKEFKGKVLYIDTWATWCKPCIAEFPGSISLRSSYKDNSDVVFIFLSIDSDEQKWKTYLNNNPDMKSAGV